MSLASKPRQEPFGAHASLLHPAGANCAPALLSSLRVAQLTSDPFTGLYAQLRQIAQSALRRSGPQLTVSPTTLLHEAYLKISARDALGFPDRARFMAYASRAMRRLVIDFVRERRALKRGAGFEITSMPIEAAEVAAASRSSCSASATRSMSSPRSTLRSRSSSTCISSAGFRSPRSRRCWISRSAR